MDTMTKPKSKPFALNPLHTETPKRPLAWHIAPNLLTSIRYAMEGVSYAFRTQRNFRIQTCLGTVGLGLGFWLHIEPSQIALICVMIALVLALELINSALESVVDLTVQQTYHELAKIAKDCAAGAVFVAALGSLAVACLTLMPALLQRLS